MRHEPFASVLRRRASEGRGSTLRERVRDDPSPRDAAPGAAADAVRPLLWAGGSEAPPIAAPAAAQRIALAAEAVRRAGGGQVEVGLEAGAALRLKARHDGVGLELCVPPSLSAIAASELPALVNALRLRGIHVARAEVRASPDRGRRGAGRSR